MRWVAECSARLDTLAGTLIRRLATHVLMLADALLHGLKVSDTFTGALLRCFA